MSDFLLTLVLQIKTSKIINDMAKVQQKSEKISAFGGIFFVLDRFDRRSGDSDLFGSLICYYSLNNPVTDARYSGQLSESCSLVA